MRARCCTRGPSPGRGLAATSVIFTERHPTAAATSEQSPVPAPISITEPAVASRSLTDGTSISSHSRIEEAHTRDHNSHFILGRGCDRGAAALGGGRAGKGRCAHLPRVVAIVQPQRIDKERIRRCDVHLRRCQRWASGHRKSPCTRQQQREHILGRDGRCGRRMSRRARRQIPAPRTRRNGQRHAAPPHQHGHQGSSLGTGAAAHAPHIANLLALWQHVAVGEQHCCRFTRRVLHALGAVPRQRIIGPIAPSPQQHLGRCQRRQTLHRRRYRRHSDFTEGR